MSRSANKTLHRAGVLLGATLSVVIVATSPAYAETTQGRWQNLPDNRSNWYCGPTQTKELDMNGILLPGGQIYFYSQLCIIDSNSSNVTQTATILRRDSVNYPNVEIYAKGWSRIIWNNGASLSTNECATDKFLLGEVQVCFSRTKPVASGQVVKAWGGADSTSTYVPVVLASPPEVRHTNR
jgi:hypothetical protein